MGLGIGLGAFTDGLSRGIGIRRDQEEFDLAKEDRLRRIGQEQEDRRFEIEERERAKSKRSERESVAEEARDVFDEKVASGEMSEADFNTFWEDYTIPRLRNVLLEQQDYEGAAALDEWADSQDAKRGGKLVGSVLLKAQTGDHDGALEDVIEVSKINGYLNSDYEIVNAEPVEDEQGNKLGYRLDIQTDDGIVQQDIALQDIPQIISTFANPAAAFQSQLESRAAQSTRRQELEDFATKESIKASAASGKDAAKLRADAIKSIEDERSDSLEEMPSFYNLPKDEQESMINQRISVMTGEDATVVPEPTMLVDQEFGQAVPTGISRPTAPAQPEDVLPVRDDEMLDLNWPEGAEDPGVTSARRRKLGLPD